MESTVCMYLRQICVKTKCVLCHTPTHQRKEFRSECDKDYKLMDVVDFSVYWDSETIGEMEGDNLVVSGSYVVDQYTHFTSNVTISVPCMVKKYFCK